MTVEEVDEALNRLRARGTYEQIINQMSEPT
jgi:ABC-type amino acid transport substrate-binding protein